jgi:divalent metal cation (Fe/Co/Zn/Cd) transporter
VTRIITHIEPTGDAVATIHGERAGHSQVQKAIADFLHGYPLAVKPHDIKVQQVGGELAVSFHCTLDASTAITAAHDLTVRLEEYLRAHVPGLGRVAIHVEPNKEKQG